MIDPPAVRLAQSARSAAPLADLCELAFENRFVRELPADPVRLNVPREVRNACYTRVDPTPVRAPRLLAGSDALEQGDASVLERLMAVLAQPYDEQPAHEALAARRPEWARNRPGCSALSCSS